MLPDKTRTWIGPEVASLSKAVGDVAGASAQEREIIAKYEPSSVLLAHLVSECGAAVADFLC